jgi:hypothetical protein
MPFIIDSCAANGMSFCLLSLPLIKRRDFRPITAGLHATPAPAVINLSLPSR